MTFNPLSVDLNTARRLNGSIITSERLHNRVLPEKKQSLIPNRASLIVETPTAGLPARSGSEISAAECTIQTIKKQDQGDVLESGQTIIVYNLNESAIAGNQTILATRDRNGNFIAGSMGRKSTGVFRVTFVQDFSETDSPILCNVSKSDFELESQVNAANRMKLESDAGGTGYCLVFEDGSIDLIAAVCPAES